MIKKVITNLIMVVLFLGLIAMALSYLYQNYPSSAQNLKVDYNLNQKILSAQINSAPQVTQFYPKLRFNHNNISYSISKCDYNKEKNILQAFSTLHSQVKLISFYEVKENPDIFVSCSKEDLKRFENKYVAGEGGPNYIINTSTYPVIINASMIIYKEDSCKNSIVEMHELLHVFGFEHNNNSRYILYPILDCNQVLYKGYIDYLNQLYAIKPFAELYFSEDNITKAGRYLSFEILIENQGIIDADNIKLIVYADNEKIKEFEMNTIEFGTGKSLRVTNLKLNSRSSKQVKLEIQTSQEEYNKQNNVLVANVE